MKSKMRTLNWKVENNFLFSLNMQSVRSSIIRVDSCLVQQQRQKKPIYSSAATIGAHYAFFTCDVVVDADVVLPLLRAMHRCQPRIGVDVCDGDADYAMMTGTLVAARILWNPQRN